MSIKERLLKKLIPSVEVIKENQENKTTSKEYNPIASEEDIKNIKKYFKI